MKKGSREVQLPQARCAMRSLLRAPNIARRRKPNRQFPLLESLQPAENKAQKIF